MSLLADSESTIRLPQRIEPTRRPPWPVLASLVPLLGGIVMFLVTRSPLALCIAALGPLMAVASILDGRRNRRREQRRLDTEHAERVEACRARIRDRHDRERQALWRREGDVATIWHDGARVWRSPADTLVVGRGTVPSTLTVSGGDDNDPLRGEATSLAGAPVATAWRGGICVRGPRPIAQAVARALLCQLMLRTPPGRLQLVAAPPGEKWTDTLPHRRHDADTTVGWYDGAPGDAGVAIVTVETGDDPPEHCAVLLTLDTALSGTLTAAGEERRIDLEAVSPAQAAAIAARLDARAPVAQASEEGALLLDGLDPVAAGPVGALLPVAIGRGPDGDAIVDLVADGPHALVVGTTGAGKSELLTTWIAALARSYTPDRVTFLLADFKGGTAFDALAPLPHVTGVVTDLDSAGARRAVESLHAEVRRRERVLTSCGARDIAEADGMLPRLVIVVDEYAALVAQHDDLASVFADVAARGRALGMHLILGTQRATGTVTDALAANAPLRIALRVSERAESRFVVGTDEAATLSGAPQARGRALIRRGADETAWHARIALTPPETIRSLADRPVSVRVHAPWLPPLPTELALDALESGKGIALGLADDPLHQAQPVVRLIPGEDRALVVLGGPGSGKSTLARLVLAQHAGAVAVPVDPEGAWDVVHSAMESPPPVLVIDDVDVLVASYPTEHAAVMLDRLEGILRDAGRTGLVVLTATRPTGAIGRLLDLAPRRAVLRLPTRADHVAAGVDGTAWQERRPPGRAHLDGLETQFALAPSTVTAHPPVPGAERRWRPEPGMTVLVVRSARRRCLDLADSWGASVSITLLDDLEPGVRPDQLSTPGTLVIAGDPEAWQRQWALLAALRQSAPVVVSTECAVEARALTGDRELPPYARTRSSRAWLYADGAEPVRIILPRAGT